MDYRLPHSLDETGKHKHFRLPPIFCGAVLTRFEPADSASETAACPNKLKRERDMKQREMIMHSYFRSLAITLSLDTFTKLCRATLSYVPIAEGG